jgi:hypothetical protein
MVSKNGFNNSINMTNFPSALQICNFITYKILFYYQRRRAILDAVPEHASSDNSKTGESLRRKAMGLPPRFRGHDCQVAEEFKALCSRDSCNLGSFPGCFFSLYQELATGRNQ